MKSVMYHYVREASQDLPYFRFLHYRQFEKQLDWFESNGGLVTQLEFENYLDVGEVPRGFLLTFDDGFVDHYKYVAPALAKRGLWGIFFVPTAIFDGEDLLDVHKIHWLLGRYGADEVAASIEQITNSSLKSLLPTEIYTQQTSGFSEKAVKYFLNYYCSERERKRVLNVLFENKDVDLTKLADETYLDLDMINEMLEMGFSIQAHSHSHRLLSALSADLIGCEVSHSVEKVSELTSHSVTKGFCVPYGGPESYNDDVINCIRGAGVKYNFIVNSKDIDCESNVLKLPRYDCNEFPFGKTQVG